MSRPLFAVATTILSFWSSLALAQKPQAKIRVTLNVTCDQCADTVRSYLARELRKLPDVVITNDSPHKELWVIVSETAEHRPGTPPNAYAMAYIFVDLTLRNMIANGIEYQMQQCACSEGHKKILAVNVDSIREGLVGAGNFQQRVFPAEALEAQCRDVIKEFDGELEAHRKAFHQLDEFVDKTRGRTPVMPH